MHIGRSWWAARWWSDEQRLRRSRGDSRRRFSNAKSELGEHNLPPRMPLVCGTDDRSIADRPFGRRTARPKAKRCRQVAPALNAHQWGLLRRSSRPRANPWHGVGTSSVNASPTGSRTSGPKLIAQHAGEQLATYSLSTIPRPYSPLREPSAANSLQGRHAPRRSPSDRAEQCPTGSSLRLHSRLSPPVRTGA